MTFKSLGYLLITILFTMFSILKATGDNMGLELEPVVSGLLGLGIDILIILVPIVSAMLFILRLVNKEQESVPIQSSPGMQARYAAILRRHELYNKRIHKP